MEKPSVFISVSFQEEDAPIADMFQELVRVVGMKPFIDRLGSRDSRVDKIRKHIRDRDLFIAVMTRHKKLEGKDEWTIRDWIQHETVYALGIGKKPLVFVEKGISLGGMMSDAVTYLPFERENLASCIADIVGTLIEAKRDFMLERQLDDLGLGEGDPSQVIKQLHERIEQLEANRPVYAKTGYGTEDGTIMVDGGIACALDLASPGTLVVLAMITKYRPGNQAELLDRVERFGIGPDQFHQSMAHLLLSGLVWIGHPHDRRRREPEYAPLELDERARPELEKWFRVHWKDLFRNFLKIEPDFDTPT